MLHLNWENLISDTSMPNLYFWNCSKNQAKIVTGNSWLKRKFEQ
jgi:hypothetical protein